MRKRLPLSRHNEKEAADLEEAKAFYLEEEWKVPECPGFNGDPTFLFLFTLPYSGSTALAQILSSAPASATLTPNGEGQWLVRGLSRGDRWHPGKAVHWQSVRAIWMHRIQALESVRGAIRLVIEKSPPHLVRSEALLQHFPRHRLMVFNRNPYAHCASLLFRQHRPESKTADERKDILARLANSWVRRSKYARAIVDDHDPVFFTYEDFCRDVKASLERAAEGIPELRGASADAKVRVKDYPPQRIVNLNHRQIARLSEEERAVIGRTLEDHEELLNFFHYTSDWERGIERGGARTTEPCQT